MTANPGRVTAYPGNWRRLVRRAGPGTVRTRVTVLAGLALTAAVVLRFPRPLPASVLDTGSGTPVRQPAADRVLPSDLSVYGERVTAGGRPVTIITTTVTYLRSQVNETFARLLVIGRLASTMNDMLARLEDAAARQRRFVADASHELRSPLTAIRTALEVGLSHPDRAPWPEIASRAMRQSRRLEQLIAELLVLARADAGQLAARRQRVGRPRAGHRPGDRDRARRHHHARRRRGGRNPGRRHHGRHGECGMRNTVVRAQLIS